MFPGRNKRMFFICITILQVLSTCLSSCHGVGDETKGLEIPTSRPAITATLEQLPNLVVEAVHIQNISQEECSVSGVGEFQVDVRVVNIGEADAGTFHVLINDDQEGVISELLQGESADFDFSIMAERIWIKVDNREEVIEEDETDNFYEAEEATEPQPTCTPTPVISLPPDFSVLPLLPEDMTINIIQIQMFDESVGWAIGSEEEDLHHILRTDDGGYTWLDVTPPELIPDSDPSFMRATANFMDAVTAWVTFQADPHRQPGVLWHTHDGGRVWEPSRERMRGVIGSASSWPVIDFIDHEMGWMLVNHFVGESTYEAELFQSVDGGITWELIHNDQVVDRVVGSAGGIDFLDGSDGVLTSTNPLEAGVYVYWTRDSGRTWTEKKLSAPDTNQALFDLLACGISAPKLFSPDSCLLSVFCYNPGGVSVPYLYRTMDAGRTWQTYPFPGEFMGVSMDIIDPNLIFVLGRIVDEEAEGVTIERGELHRSDDGGRSWSIIASIDWYGPIHFINERLGWAIDRSQSGNTLLRTYDGGLSWEKIQTRTISDETFQRSIVLPSGIVLPEELLPITLNNIDQVQALDQQLLIHAVDIAFSSDGASLVIAQEDGWIVQWPVRELAYPLAAYKHSGRIIDVDVAADVGTLVSAFDDGKVWVWFMESPIQYTLGEGFGEVSTLALTPNGNRLAVALSDGSVEFWDLSENLGKSLGSMVGAVEQVLDMAFSHDGQQLAVASSEGSIVVWDLITSEQLMELVGHTAEVTSIAFAPTAPFLTSASKDGSIRIWDLTAQEEIVILEDETPEINSIALSPDGQLLAAGAEDGYLYLWETQSGELAKVLKGDGSPILIVVFSTLGEVIASASEDGVIQFWGAQGMSE